jgi:WXXGXW repeat (2 copies)
MVVFHRDSRRKRIESRLLREKLGSMLDLSFIDQTSTFPYARVSTRSTPPASRSLEYSWFETVLFNPRDPQPQRVSGHAKKNRPKGKTMRIISSVRSLLFAVMLLALSAAAYAQISLSISFAPPELPTYEQPLCPGDGYLWTPGYWAYADDDGYYWVPGTWVLAPEPGLLWTPAYWGWGGNGYVFNEGYWGTEVGFYGGVSYGYGYSGRGYEGGRWQGGQFYYNRSVSNVNVTNIHNVYNTTVINNTTVNRVSYNGGTGGISARPTPQQESVAHERHIPPVAAQTQHAQSARSNPQQRASVNHGTPSVAATPKPGAFNDRAAIPAQQGGKPYNAPVNRAAVQPPANPPAGHPERNAPRPETPAAPNAKSDPNRAEPNHPPVAPPNNRPEPNRPATTQPKDRPEPNRPEPAPRPQTPSPSERSQPARTPPPAEPRSASQPRPQPQAPRPEEKKQRKEEPKHDEKPQS